MTQKKTNISSTLKVLLVLSNVILSVLLLTNTSFASTQSTIAFKWKANPSKENIRGYKLYYGKKSRYYGSGVKKTNFQYDYCVDFNEQVRCSGKNFKNCVRLGSAQLDCDNLHSTSPICRIKKSSDYKFFTLTAYNHKGESEFTQELRIIDNKVPGALHLLLN